MSAVPDSALDLHESVSYAETLEEADGQSLFDEHGRVKVHIIRPGVGKGRGRHLYESKMLQEAAGGFRGWKMFVDHQSPEAKKAAAGLPRSLRDVGGIIKESWWDPNVPADPDNGWGQGAVVGLAKPRKWIRELIEDDPALAEASIRASATGVRPVIKDNQRTYLVEGIAGTKPGTGKKGSVDWVTEAGAGGRVADLLEAELQHPEEMEAELLESMTDEEIVQYLRDNRPSLVEAMKKDDADPDADGDDDGDGGDDSDLQAEISRLTKKGLPRAMAEKAAKKNLKESAEGDDDMALTPESLQEALAESPELLVGVLQESAELQGYLDALVEAKVEERTELTETQAEAAIKRERQLARMERSAHKVIAESRLPERCQDDLRKEFALEESGPSQALNVVDEVGEDGKVTKAASEVLQEALDARIDDEWARVRAIGGATRVRGQGPVRDDGDRGTKVDPSKTGWGRFLQETAHVDPKKAFNLVGAGEDA